MTDSLTPSTAASVPADDATTLKSGTVGTTHIVAMVIAAAAPIASAVALIPLGMLLGNGAGMPGALLLVSLILAVFAVGFVKILPYITNTGAIYAYVSAGLGRPTGLASAYVLSVVYVALGASVVGGFSYFATALMERFFDFSPPWLIVAVACVVIGTAMAVTGVSLTARVLLAILTLELIGLLVVDIAIVVQQGLPAFTLDVFSPSTVFTGAIGVAVIYAFSMFLGFEATAIYSEEAKAPRRTIPRATYIILVLIGGLYTFSSWAMVAGTGADQLVPTVAEDPGTFVFRLSDHYVGSAWTDILSVLNALSLFAGVLAFQNAGARYLFALSRDNMAPRALGITHPKTGTPSVGLISIAVVFVLLSIAYFVADYSPLLDMSTSLVGMGTIGLVGMLTVASISIAVFFLRRKVIGVTTVGAPVLAAILLGLCTYAGIDNYGALTGVPTWWVNNLPWLLLVVAAAALAYGFWVRTKYPKRYELIGKTRI